LDGLRHLSLDDLKAHGLLEPLTALAERNREPLATPVKNKSALEATSDQELFALIDQEISGPS
jgi:hypothetical protein